MTLEFNWDDLDFDMNENFGSNTEVCSVTSTFTKKAKVEDVLELESKSKKLSRYSLEHYESDIEIYEEIMQDSTIIQDVVKAGMANLATYDDLNKDMFLSLYKYNAKIVPEERMEKTNRVNNIIMKKVVKSDQFKDLRDNCKLNSFCAALGTEILSTETANVIDEWKAEIQEELENRNADFLENLENIKNAEQKLSQLNEQQQVINELLESNQDNQMLQCQAQSVQKQIDNAQKEYDENVEELDDIIDSGKVDDLLDDVAEKISENFTYLGEYMSEVEGDISAWGLDEGNLARISFENKKIALERIRRSRKLKDLTDIIGRFKASATKQQKKMKQPNGGIKGVTIGDKIEKLLPSEKMKLCNKTTKREFLMKYSQKQLLQYNTQSKKNKNKGPIICCIDTSGSMHGSREAWSKAIALGMLEIAQEQRRDFCAILFDSTIDAVIEVPKDNKDANKILDIAERFSSGGTNFTRPLEEALNQLKSSKFKEADITFITDGDCGIDNSFVTMFNRQKKEKQFKVVSVLINTSQRVSTKTLDKFSDEVHHLSAIAELRDANSDLTKQLFSI